MRHLGRPVAARFRAGKTRRPSSTRLDSCALQETALRCALPIGTRAAREPENRRLANCEGRAADEEQESNWKRNSENKWPLRIGRGENWERIARAPQLEAREFECHPKSKARPSGAQAGGSQIERNSLAGEPPEGAREQPASCSIANLSSFAPR